MKNKSAARQARGQGGKGKSREAVLMNWQQFLNHGDAGPAQAPIDRLPSCPTNGRPTIPKIVFFFSYRISQKTPVNYHSFYASLTALSFYLQITLFRHGVRKKTTKNTTPGRWLNGKLACFVIFAFLNTSSWFSFILPYLNFLRGLSHRIIINLSSYCEDRDYKKKSNIGVWKAL